jgi:protein-S-isoprenylcysteine O-methyltransferase Ste14
VFWIVSAFRQKSAKRKEPVIERLSQMLAIAAAYFLLFKVTAHFGWLNARFVPYAQWVGFIGFVCTVVGLSLAIWARIYLGTNWSATVSIRSGHELISAGPYRRIRHPIYTGMLCATAGTALARGEIRGVISFTIVFAAFYLKARKEEKYLEQEFGKDFQVHLNRTGMFLPRIV